MSVINASQGSKGIVTVTGPVGKFFGWLSHFFHHAPPVVPAPTTTVHGEGDSPIESNLMEFGWDKTGGWDRRKKGGWSPHGDGGMR